LQFSILLQIASTFSRNLSKWFKTAWVRIIQFLWVISDLSHFSNWGYSATLSNFQSQTAPKPANMALVFFADRRVACVW